MLIVFFMGLLLVWQTGMYMFNLNRQTNLLAIAVPIQIKHVHSSVSYQQATYQKYDRRYHESPSGYGPLGPPGIRGGTGRDLLRTYPTLYFGVKSQRL